MAASHLTLEEFKPSHTEGIRYLREENLDVMMCLELHQVVLGYTVTPCLKDKQK